MVYSLFSGQIKKKCITQTARGESKFTSPNSYTVAGPVSSWHRRFESASIPRREQNCVVPGLLNLDKVKKEIHRNYER